MHHIKHNVRPFIPNAIIFYVYFRYLATAFEWAEWANETMGRMVVKSMVHLGTNTLRAVCLKGKKKFQSKIDVNETSVSAKGLGNCH